MDRVCDVDHQDVAVFELAERKSATIPRGPPPPFTELDVECTAIQSDEWRRQAQKHSEANESWHLPRDSCRDDLARVALTNAAQLRKCASLRASGTGDSAETAMADKVRRRSRRIADRASHPATSEDVLAFEGEIDIGASGVPMSFLPGREPDDDDAQRLIQTPGDASKGWWQRTRDSVKGDASSIALLLFLYLLQIGRRKSWMIPCQYLIGIFMLLLSFKVDYIMGDKEHPPKVLFLLFTFLPLNFLAATQDIAVDGWALTMLSRKNVGYASTCNAVGQTAGFFIGNVVFLGLESKDFANMFRAVPQDHGFISLADFLLFWGCVFIVSTTLVFFLKREVDHSIEAPQTAATTAAETCDDSDEREVEMGIFETYKVLLKILCLRPMIYMVIMLLTGKIAFAATDGMTSLRLVEMGIPKDKLAMFGLFLTPVQIALPWLIGKWTTGPRPLNIFMMAYPYRLLVGGVYALLVWWTPSFRHEGGGFEIWVYVIWIVAFIFHQFATYSMFVSMMAFNAQISDPRIGGTYMTLLNTINNLGGNYPVTLILWIADHLTWKDCLERGTRTFMYQCHEKEVAKTCLAAGYSCETVVDGYYLAVAICSVVGILWALIFFGKLRYVQKIARSEWHVMKSR